jgi:Acetyltransferase (GNAT) domain
MGLLVANSANAAARKGRQSSAPGPKQIGVTILSREQFQQWDALVSISPHGTVFHYSWWLEATGGEFKILGCWDKGGNLVGGIPLPFKRRAGFTLYYSPPLTPYLGPIFDLTVANNPIERLSVMRCCGERLARAIEGFDSLSYMAGAAAPDLQGFLWAGFRADLTYTFRIGAGTTVDNAFQQIARTHRQKLKKHTQYIVESGDDVNALALLSNQTFERQGMARPFTESYLRSLWREVSKRGRGVVYTARDLGGQPAAALFVVNDNRTSYQIVSGVDMSSRNSPAGALLTWRAISDALNAGRIFDFEGSRIRGVEEYYRRWGGQAHPVWHLKKIGSLRASLANFVFNSFYGENETDMRPRITPESQLSGPNTIESGP